jgi:hypothetical protein
MTLDASGNLGVGTTSPSGSDWNVNSTVVQVKKNDSSGGLFKASSSNVDFIFSAGNGLAYIATTTNTPITFYTNTTERARITSGGDFRVKGAGTAGSTDAFQVSGSAPADAARIDSSGNLLVGTTTSPSGSKKLVVTGSDTNGAIKIQGSSTDYQGLSLYYSASGANANARAFQIAPNYIANGRLDFLISSSNSTDPTTSLGYINGSTGAYTAVSDARAKKNIVDCQYGLSSVMSMRPVLYNMVSENDGTIKHIGFIAQEIKAVINEAVADTDSEEQWYGLDKSELVPVLVKAIQEQQAIITALTARVAALEGTQP